MLCQPNTPRWSLLAAMTLSVGLLALPAAAQQKTKAKAKANVKAKASQRAKPITDADLPWPPELPGKQAMVTDQSKEMLEPPADLREGVKIAKTPPAIDLMYYPLQNYPGNPWSKWCDGTIANGKYYSAIGDHRALGRGSDDHSTGNGHVYEYDPETKQLRSLVDLIEMLKLPEGHYTPGKIHSRVDMGRDGWLYYSTHRGSPKAANDENHYRGDWIFRTNPETGKSEVGTISPVPKHSIPASILDPDRLIFYGATAAGPDAELQGVQFFAYDLNDRKLLYSGPDGPNRYMMLARSTGKLYYVPGTAEGNLMRFDPEQGGPPQQIDTVMGIRAATQETKDGKIYAVSLGQRSDDTDIWEFDTKTEQAKKIGAAAVGSQAYVASLDVDPTGRYLYYVPGAHGGGPKDGSPVVQFDIKTGTKKVLAFLDPYYQKKYGLQPKGTYSTDISESGDKLYITWNVSRGTRAWDSCALSVVHIPESER